MKCSINGCNKTYYGKYGGNNDPLCQYHKDIGNFCGCGGHIDTCDDAEDPREEPAVFLWEKPGKNDAIVFYYYKEQKVTKVGHYSISTNSISNGNRLVYWGTQEYRYGKGKRDGDITQLLPIEALATYYPNLPDLVAKWERHLQSHKLKH